MFGGMENTSPLRPADDEGRAIARRLLQQARFAALGVLQPQTDLPFVSRIALAAAAGSNPVSLISSLSQHSTALKANPACSLLVGEPGPKGDALTHPRLTLQCEARFLPREAPGFAAQRDRYLSHHPKARLYIDFADFSFAFFEVREAFLNGGFGFASMLTPADLGIEEAAGQA